MRRSIIMILPLLMLGSCQFSMEIKARYDGDRLVFDAGPKSWFGPEHCIIGDFVVLDGQRPVWAIEEAEIGKHDCADGRDFPLAYGEEPEGFVTKVAPAKLVVGRVYTIAGGAGIHSHGSFRIGYAVANLSDN